MLYLTLGLFALAAVVGLIILKNWLTSATTPRAVVYTHGLFAAAALVLLLLLALRDPGRQLRVALLLFGVAAAGGFYMFFQDLRGKFSPMWLAFTHAGLALAGFVVLLLTLI
ncbi:MAG: hypothetical protein EOO11_16985 [Chitinophagaceae bacterium]|nr:MAG: hypothetical protein EOO11_16985 [Chitinophagaceae bacterium]